MKPFWKCWIEALLFVLSVLAAGLAIFFVAAYIAAFFGLEMLVALIIFLIIVTIIAFGKWLGGD